MRLLKLVLAEQRLLERAWSDDAGRRYRNEFLRPIEDCAEELAHALRQFENGLPRGPARR